MQRIPGADKIGTYLTKRGVTIIKSDLSSKIISQIKDELTVKPVVQEAYQYNAVTYKIYLENERKLYIPRFYAQEKGFRPRMDRLPEGSARRRLVFKGGLRPLQEKAKHAFMQANGRCGGGIISLATGQGKTVVALNIICELQKKTLILVHKGFLLNQWIERIEQFVPDAKIGVIQQGRFEVSGKDIIIGMIQTICKREFTNEQRTQLDKIGCVLADECHHVSSEVFNRSMFKLASGTMIGLTATPRRKDQLERVFKWHLGDVVFTPPEKNQFRGLCPVVRITRYRGVGKDFQTAYSRTGQISVPMMMSKLVNNSERNRFVVSAIEKMARDPLRHILVLSERRKHLQIMQRMLDRAITSGFYVGGMKQAELKESEGKRVIFATYQMVSEAFDLPSLNTLFLTTSCVDIEQSIGRIMRKEHTDTVPTIIDIADQHSIFFAQSRKRLCLYRGKGLKVIFCSSCDDPSEEESISSPPATKKIKIDLENYFSE